MILDESPSVGHCQWPRTVAHAGKFPVGLDLLLLEAVKLKHRALRWSFPPWYSRTMSALWTASAFCTLPWDIVYAASSDGVTHRDAVSERGKPFCGSNRGSNLFQKRTAALYFPYQALVLSPAWPNCPSFFAPPVKLAVGSSSSSHRVLVVLKRCYPKPAETSVIERGSGKVDSL